MTFLAARLNKRGSIRKPVQTPNTTTGGFDYTYEIVTPIWLELKPISSSRIVGAMYVRGTQTADYPTHIITVRRNASLGVDFVATATPRVTNDYRIFVDGADGKGRMFQIMSSLNKDERGEYLELIVKEIEEQGQTEFVS